MKGKELCEQKFFRVLFLIRLQSTLNFSLTEMMKITIFKRFNEVSH